MTDSKINAEEPRYEETKNGEPFQMRSPSSSPRPVPPSSSMKTEELAGAIAKAFSDEENLQMYLSLCTRYGTEACRRAFIRATETPDDKIKKSRIALFVYLARKYATGKGK
jgi:hypothetical protein